MKGTSIKSLDRLFYKKEILIARYLLNAILKSFLLVFIREKMCEVNPFAREWSLEVFISRRSGFVFVS